MTSAKVICDSVSPSGVRLTTMEVKYHRFVLAEMNTHRVFSRNTASSRAIPYKKLRQSVIDDPALPLAWPEEQQGMQGGKELNVLDIYEAHGHWLAARDRAVEQADNLHALGVHKSVINRLLEPFQYITSIISATNWQGFWDQRDSELAQPEIRAAAQAMRAAYDKSTPQAINFGGWHLPYIVPDDYEEACNLKLTPHETLEIFKQISAARCARVSYLTHAGKRDLSADLNLFKRLITAYPPHWSPLEHVASPVPIMAKGNFTGWLQLRHMIESRELGKRDKNIL